MVFMDPEPGGSGLARADGPLSPTHPGLETRAAVGGAGEDDQTAMARRALSGVLDTQTGLSIEDLGLLHSVDIEGTTIRVGLTLPAELGRAADALSDAAAAALGVLENTERVEVLCEEMTPPQRDEVAARLRAARTELAAKLADGTTKLIAVASGKGGVGKSTVTVNLACALAAQGKRVGVVDLDVWGYSVPRMLGVRGRPFGIGDTLLPMQAHGVRTVSVGLLVDDEATPVVWRGPLLHETVAQFLAGVYWGELDVLLADLPPGTGDVPISLATVARDAQVVVVTTPQEAAERVAERAGRMARHAGLRLAGVIENMASFACPHCGETSDIFGHAGGEELARRLAVPLLGRIPVSVALRAGGDAGRPIVVDDPDSPAAHAFVDTAARVERATHAVVRKRLPLSVVGAPGGGGASRCAVGSVPGGDR